MDRLIQLALQYGQGKLTEASLAKAREVLGLSSPLSNTNAGIYGLPQSNFQKLKSSFSPMRMIANQGIKSLMGSGKMGGMLSAAAPFALGAGAIYLLNKNREKLTGFKTQAAYEANLNQRRANSRLDKITDRLTSGKDYGKYEEALLDSGAGAVKIDGKVMFGSDYFPEPIKPAPAPVTVYYGGGNDSGGGGGGSNNYGSSGKVDTGGFEQDGTGRQGYGRGGIASL